MHRQNQGVEKKTYELGAEMVKRIAFLCIHTSPLALPGGEKTGGMNVYVREAAKELARRGIAIDIFTRRYDPMLPEIDTSLGENIRVIHLAAGSPQYLDPAAVYPHLAQFTAGVVAFTTRQNSHYDLVYSHYWLGGWVAKELKEIWGAPFAQMFHTLGHIKQRLEARSILLSDARIITEAQIVKSANRIIAATPAEQAELSWLCQAAWRKITIIPPGVDVTRFHPIAQAEAKRRLNIPQTGNLLLFVGRIEPLKAVDVILEAVNHLRGLPLFQQTSVAIIGGNLADPMNHELRRLKALTEDLRLDGVVQFLGMRDHESLPLYYAAAAAVIVPSDYESFGMVALEAMASGAPVIAANVGGLAFLVRDQSTGLLVPPRDPISLAQKIRTLLTDSEKRQRLGQNAAQVAQQYAWPGIVDRLLGVFEEMTARDRATCPGH